MGKASSQPPSGPGDTHVEVARLSLRQAVLVAIISAFGGVATALITTGVFKDKEVPASDQLSKSLEQQTTVLRSELDAAKEKVEHLGRSNAALQGELREARADAKQEQEQRASLQAQLNEERKRRSASNVPPLRGDQRKPEQPAAVTGKRILLVHSDESARTALDLKKRLERAGATVVLATSFYTYSLAQLRQPAVYYRAPEHLEAAVVVQELLKPLGVQTVSAWWNREDPDLSRVDIAVGFLAQPK